MKLNKKRLALSFLILVFILIQCSSKKNEIVDQLFEAYRGDSVPGAAVMIIHKGRPVLTKTYGMADLEEKIPVYRQTNFRLASVTKQFTAMCIMILKERGALDYKTTLKEIFPSFPDYGEHITIQHLLRHTSGLIAYEDLISDTASVQVTDNDVLQMMLGVDSTYFQPGTAHRYSNSGYAVLAMIIKKVSGKSVAGFLKENIFHPLGMNHTVAHVNGFSTVSNRAYGYTVEPDSIRFTDQSITSAVLGDGGIYSSIDDLLKWDRALYTDKLISAETLKLAFTPALDNYGFGWRIDEYRGHVRVYHTGSTRGFRTFIQRFPEDKFTVIILTNRSDPEVAPLAEKLADLYLIGQ